MSQSSETSLDDRLAAAAASGELNYVSIVPKAGKGGIIWTATAAQASKFGHYFASDPDPAKAIHLVLDELKYRKPRAQKEPERDPLDDL